jgi:hypothetical protein
MPSGQGMTQVLLACPDRRRCPARGQLSGTGGLLLLGTHKGPIGCESRVLRESRSAATECFAGDEERRGLFRLSPNRTGSAFFWSTVGERPAECRPLFRPLRLRRLLHIPVNRSAVQSEYQCQPDSADWICDGKRHGQLRLDEAGRGGSCRCTRCREWGRILTG